MTRAESEIAPIRTTACCTLCTRPGDCLQKKLLFSDDGSPAGIFFQETYPPGALVPGHSTLGKGIYTVCAGQLKVRYETPDGRVAFLRIAGEGDTVLEPFLGPHGGPLAYSLVTVEQSSLCFLPAALLLRSSRAATYVLVSLLEAHLRLIAEYQALLALRAVKDAGRRVAMALMEASGKAPDPPGQRHLIRLTHQDLAHLSGLTQEDVARGLKELRPFGVAPGSNGRISFFPERLDAVIIGTQKAPPIR